MKFSYQWLRELVPDLATEPSEVERLITLKTAECEGIEAAGDHFASVVAARVLSVNPLAKGKNQSVLIDIGDGKQVTVVCGAPNVRTGMLAPWVPPGTQLGVKTIGRAVIEGVESEGMLASAAELGISRDASGLLELHNVPPSARLPALEPDWIIEIDNKSLTHRPDLWGHYGLAREVAAITGTTLKDPVDPAFLPQGEAGIKVTIADGFLCQRYSALVFENVKVSPSPLRLQARLESLDLNTINNVVDVTNYILAELPQPMHAFDADKLKGDTIFVRNARIGEQLPALNGETYSLTEADLVVADAAGPIALAGVIGGADTAISESTTRIVLESANFPAASIRSTSVRHKLRTDASVRFEKSLDPENTVRGLARAVELLAEVCPSAKPVAGVTDVRGPLTCPDPIALPIDFVARKLGTPLSEEEVGRILSSLGFGVSQTAPGLLSVTVPSWRATKDISLKDDLVEEVGRMVGYAAIVPVAPLVASVVPPPNRMRTYLRQVRSELANQGFSEVYNYSFVTGTDAARFNFDLADHIGVRNPIASEWTHLRRSLLPGIFKNIVANAHNFAEFRLFEIGNEIYPVLSSELPKENTHLTAVLYNAHAEEQTFFELKRILECVFPDARLTPVTEVQPYEHPTRIAEVQWRDSRIGRLFELYPALLSAENIEGRAIVFDVDLQLCVALSAEHQTQYKPIPKYPTSGFDLSVDTLTKTPVGSIEESLSKLAGDNLAAISFVRQYDGPPLLEGQKSVSYHLEIGATDHTLTSEEVTAIWERIVNGMLAEGYEIRGLD